MHETSAVQSATWPFADLTPLQQRDRARMEAALRAGALPRWPAGMGVFAAAAAAALIAGCGGGDPEPTTPERERVPTPPACAASQGACQ